MAERMRLDCPALPVGSMAERTLFNQFMIKNPTPTVASLRTLALDFFGKVDCKAISPKTVVLLKAHLSRWKEDNIIRQMVRKVGSRYNPFLRQLAQCVEAPTCRVPANVAARSMEPDVSREDVGHENATGEMSANTNELQVQVQIASEGTSAAGKCITCCFYRPICKMIANECGGYRKGQCCYTSESNLPDDWEAPKEACNWEAKRKRSEADRVRKRRKKAREKQKNLRFS